MILLCVAAILVAVVFPFEKLFPVFFFPSLLVIFPRSCREDTTFFWTLSIFLSDFVDFLLFPLGLPFGFPLALAFNLRCLFFQGTFFPFALVDFCLCRLLFQHRLLRQTRWYPLFLMECSLRVWWTSGVNWQERVEKEHDETQPFKRPTCLQASASDFTKVPIKKARRQIQEICSVKCFRGDNSY